MQASNAPFKSPVPFAESGSKNTIPVASQIGITPGLASFTDGFPPLTMTPLAAGGIPPRGQDFNGILNFLGAATRWQQAGSGYSFDAAFAAAVGGYPKGAQLMAVSGDSYWLSLVDNNAVDPDAGPSANWTAIATTRPATETQSGILKIATTAQAQGLTDDASALTAKKLADAFGGGAVSSLVQGYQKLPSGLIIQWGAVTITVAASAPYYFGQNAAIPYPIAFPNRCLRLSVSTSIVSTLNTAAAMINTGGNANTAFTGSVCTSGPSDCQLDFFAIGY